MERHKNLFREIPPWHLIEEVLDILGLSKHPPFTFQRNEIRLEQTIEAVSLLEPYYIPSKARQFLSHTDEKRWITVLRHILENHGWSVISKETTRDKKKTIIYSVQRVNTVMSTPVEVTFD
jgi:hypothetical protein